MSYISENLSELNLVMSKIFYLRCSPLQTTKKIHGCIDQFKTWYSPNCKLGRNTEHSVVNSRW